MYSLAASRTLRINHYVNWAVYFLFEINYQILQHSCMFKQSKEALAVIDATKIRNTYRYSYTITMVRQTR